MLANTQTIVIKTRPLTIPITRPKVLSKPLKARLLFFNALNALDSKNITNLIIIAYETYYYSFRCPRKWKRHPR